MVFLELEVKKFRHIEEQTIKLGEMITVISGQNGTGKSSLLGWVAQACSFKGEEVTITGSKFKSQYSEVFRFCSESDYGAKYTITLKYKGEEVDGEASKTMTTRLLKPTKRGKERYRVDFDRNISGSDKRALDVPVIYLGLKRLIPLATERSVSLELNELSQEESKNFSKLSKGILIAPEQKINHEGIKSTNKSMLAMKTETYSHLGNSAGQDNLGQIIAAILSFKRLNKDFKGNKKGGLLLIDEIDATLYAASQIKLVDELYKFAKKEGVQVIFTTHSLEILDHLSKKLDSQTKLNFLEIKDGLIKNTLDPSIQFLRNKIKVQIGKSDTAEKIHILCEDSVANMWCKNLIKGTQYKSMVEVSDGPFPEGTIALMAQSKNPAFKDIVFVLDGDCRDKYQKKSLPQTLFLPSDNAPESVMHKFLNGLSDSDSFWNDEENFTRQTCLLGHDNNNNYKKWIKDENFKSFFGRGYSKLFDRWQEGNREAVIKFQKDFEEMVRGRQGCD